MTSQFWMRKAVSACVTVAIITTTSMVALAAPGRIAAELTVSGKSLNGNAPVVFVNGEESKSGRSIFSSSTIATPEETSALISIGKTGRIQLEPSSSLGLVFDDTSVDAELTSGTLTVLGSLGTVRVRTNDGKTTTLAAGESISASGETQGKQQTRKGSDNWWIWVLVAAGVGVAVIVAVSQSSDDNSVVSPNR